MLETQVKGQKKSTPTNVEGETFTLRLIAGLIMLVGATAYAATQVADLQNGVVIMVAGLGGMYMAMNIGANDVANNIGAAVGSGALTMTGALVIATVFEAAGAVLAGGDVINTIAKGIIDPNVILDSDSFIRLMLAALVGAAVWINIATFFGAPVSTTHSIVGGVLGAGIAAAGSTVVNWGVIGMIAASWVMSPVLGGVIAAAFLAFIKATIVYQEDKIAAARTWVPVLVAVMGAVFAAYLMMKGLKKVWQPDTTTVLAISGATFATLYMMAKLMVASAAERMRNTREDIGRLFTIPLIGAAALLCFAHGSNDVANAIGPLAAIVHAASNGGVVDNVSIPNWVMVIGVLGLSAGLALYGAKLVRTVGTEITEIDQLRAYTVALSSAITVIVASTLAIPVSSTHIALGAIIGIGFLRERLQYEAERVKIIREFFNDKTKPKLFDSAKAEMALRYSNMERALKEPLSEQERRCYFELTQRAETALKNWQRKKLVKRSHLSKIVGAWLVTVPATAAISALLFHAINGILL